MMKLDKFYTKPEVAKQCYDFLRQKADGEMFLEPSAGDGSFLNFLPQYSVFLYEATNECRKKLYFTRRLQPHATPGFGKADFISYYEEMK